MSSKKGNTPYQGKKRTFGQYRCSGCGRYWTSAYSWAECTQKCNICGIAVYPFKQRPLLKPAQLDKSDKLKPHLMELCQKCVTLGFFCGKSKRHGKSKKRRQ